MKKCLFLFLLVIYACVYAVDNLETDYSTMADEDNNAVQYPLNLAVQDNN